ncbi:MAG TPA: hypothetical protein VHL59_03080, partial [Thermoanaerobaculia bacterium]|nr:hypothetical protein [Thermoanaerobaculia bacterium]
VIGIDRERDHSEIDRLGLPPLSNAYLDSVLAPRYREAGFEVLERGMLPASEWACLRTSWAKRLSGGASRVVLFHVARAA